ncbi:MAG: DUF4173 domain-containing protein [Patulibacter minatonensis]
MTAPTQNPAPSGVDSPMPKPPAGPPVFVKRGAAPAGGQSWGEVHQAPPGAAPPIGPPTFVDPKGYDGPPAPRRYALGALALSLFAGLVVAEQPGGIALAMLGVGLTAAAWVLVDEERRDLSSRAMLAAAGVLAAVPAFRDSEWVTSLSLLGALTLGSIAVASARTWRELGVGMVAWMLKLLPAPAIFFGQGVKRASSRRWTLAGPVARGLTLGALLVLVFGALFSAADDRFAQLVHDLFDWNLDLASVVGRALIFALTLALAGALWLVSVTRKDRPAQESTARLGRTEWLIALGSVAVVFAGFVALQLTTWFGGDEVVQLTEGLTYADNARQGFGQLTLAAILTLGVVAGARHAGPADDRWVRVLSGALCLMTLVVLASALHRLGLYVDAYGQSRTRFSMTSLMLWLGAVLLLVVALGGVRRTAWLPRAVALTSAVFAIGTVALNPDGRVAERNVQRYAETGRIDTDYLETLSADALPSLTGLPEPLASCVARHVQDETLGTGDRDPLPGLNVGRSRGRSALAALPPGQAQPAGRYSCQPYDDDRR